MRIAISGAVLLLFFGTTAFVSARQDRPQDNHQQGAKPEQKGAKPTRQQAKPAPQRAQHAARPQQRPASHAQHAARPQQRSTSHAQHANARPVPHTHGRISDARYKASFGSQHRFHISRADYQRRTFQYGGYSFRFVDPWPPAWSYNDPVYVIYLNDGYYMCDPFHPGLRITLTIF
jgi:hypothetical protein